MENYEMVCFKIISAVGTARSCYVEAIQEAKAGNFDRAKELINEGESVAVEGHHAHMGMIQQEASGEEVKTGLLLMHAEDQLMNAETIKILAEEFIELYQKLAK